MITKLLSRIHNRCGWFVDYLPWPLDRILGKALYAAYRKHNPDE